MEPFKWGSLRCLKVWLWPASGWCFKQSGLGFFPQLVLNAIRWDVAASLQRPRLNTVNVKAAAIAAPPPLPRRRCDTNRCLAAERWLINLAGMHNRWPSASSAAVRRFLQERCGMTFTWRWRRGSSRKAGRVSPRTWRSPSTCWIWTGRSSR